MQFIVWQFNSLGTNTKGLSWMMQQKTCQLMAAAALLQLVKETEDWNEKVSHRRNIKSLFCKFLKLQGCSDLAIATERKII